MLFCFSLFRYLFIWLPFYELNCIYMCVGSNRLNNCWHEKLNNNNNNQYTYCVIHTILVIFQNFHFEYTLLRILSCWNFDYIYEYKSEITFLHNSVLKIEDEKIFHPSSIKLIKTKAKRIWNCGSTKQEQISTRLMQI